MQVLRRETRPGTEHVARGRKSTVPGDIDTRRGRNRGQEECTTGDINIRQQLELKLLLNFLPGPWVLMG
jgi:hypothetical protein